MKGAYKDAVLFGAVFLLLLAGFVLADTITTSVRFVIPSNVAFAIAIPANSSTFVASGSTDQIVFNTSLQSSNGVNASVIQSGLTHFQNANVAIFLYRNDGNQDINITQTLSATPTCTGGSLELKAANSSTGYENSCSSNTTLNTTNCINITIGNQAKVVIGLPDTAPDNISIWMWADFNTCDVGLDTSVTLTHNSTASGGT